MKIAVDIDGVCGDAVERLRIYAREHYGINVDHSHVTEYDSLLPGGKVNIGTLFDEAFADNAVLLSIPVIPNARMAIEKLVRQGNNVTMVTSRKPHTKAATLAWVAHNLGNVPVLLSSRKHEHGFDLLIDDRLKFVTKFTAENDRYAILFHQPWNDGAELPPRTFVADDWLEVLDRVAWLAEHRPNGGA